MHEQLELPYMDQNPHTPHYQMWKVLFRVDNKLRFTTPSLAIKFLTAADFHEDEIALFLKENTAACKNCNGSGYFDPVMCHGFGYTPRSYWSCGRCHKTGTVFINVPTTF